nr:mannitol dehydrogenase family protein [Altererythrobacter sp. KTW20L]
MLDWFGQHCTCPSSMVDRIVPATRDTDRDEAEEATGLRDEALVVTEPFSQWVIEDKFAAGRPRWEVGGAQMVEDVRPYETAKLRMLNGAHSALAYIGLRHGHTFVHKAVADPAIRPTIEKLMREEAASSLRPAAGQDLSAYADALLARFANPALDHRLAQIAMDGSQKIPERWLEVMAHHQAAGRQCPALLAALAAWMQHVRGDGHIVDDPMARELAELWLEVGQSGIARALFGRDGLFAHNWAADGAALVALDACLASNCT